MSNHATHKCPDCGTDIPVTRLTGEQLIAYALAGVDADAVIKDMHDKDVANHKAKGECR